MYDTPCDHCGNYIASHGCAGCLQVLCAACWSGLGDYCTRNDCATTAREYGLLPAERSVNDAA